MQKVPALGCAWAVCFPCGRQQGDMDVWDATVSTMLSSTQTLCIWGTGGATPGKFLLGLRVVTCDTSTLVRPNRVLVVPASSVSLSAWVITEETTGNSQVPIILAKPGCPWPCCVSFAGPQCERSIRTSPLRSSSPSSSLSSSSSTTGLCMTLWRGPLWSSAEGTDSLGQPNTLTWTITDAGIKLHF